MIPDSQIVIPCCSECHEWMRPVMLIEYPLQAVVWDCVNKCSTVSYTPEPITPEKQYALFVIAHRLGGRQW